MTSISIICPLFNEANNLNKLFVDLDYLNRIFNKNKVKVNFILINDCSYDDSKNIISQSLPSYPQLDIELINNLQNIGFADSVKKGFNSSTSEYLMILPGDAEVDVESISDFNLQGNDLIFFERINMKSRPLFRILISHLYRIFISLIFLNRIEDYNGIYILKRDVYKKIGIDANSFFINAEVIIKCRKIKAKISKGTFSLHSKDIYKSTSLNFKQLKGVVRNITNLMHFKS